MSQLTAKSFLAGEPGKPGRGSIVPGQVQRGHANTTTADGSDCYGMLPLHIALRSFEHQCEAVVTELIQAFPDATKERDSKDMLPLQAISL